MSPSYHRKLPNQAGTVLLPFHLSRASTQTIEETKLQPFQQA